MRKTPANTPAHRTTGAKDTRLPKFIPSLYHSHASFKVQEKNRGQNMRCAVSSELNSSSNKFAASTTSSHSRKNPFGNRSRHSPATCIDADGEKRSLWGLSKTSAPAIPRMKVAEAFGFEAWECSPMLCFRHFGTPFPAVIARTRT